MTIGLLPFLIASPDLIEYFHCNKKISASEFQIIIVSPFTILSAVPDSINPV
jgi:hypothetical protein